MGEADGQPVPVRQFFHGLLGILRDNGLQLKGGVPVRGQVQENHMLRTDFTSVDFFRTMLRGMDLSDCTIDNIMVSDQYTELAGVKVNLFQAAELAKLMGVKVV